MNDEHDPRLRWLMSDAVADVEPRDALPDIRSAVHSRPQETTMSPSSRSSSNPWTYALTGALLAAAVIVAVFLLFDGSPLGGDDPDPAAGPTSGSTGKDKPTKEPSPTPSASEEPSPTAEPGGDEAVAAVYYVGTTQAGPRLFREFQSVAGADDFARGLALLQSTPADPDYTATWPEGSLTGAALGRRRHPGHHRGARHCGPSRPGWTKPRPRRPSSRSSTRCRRPHRSARRCSSCSAATPWTRCTAYPRPSRWRTARCSRCSTT